MTFVPRGKNLLHAHINSSPLGTLLKKTIDGLLPARTLVFLGRDKVRNCLAVAGDRYCLAAFDCP
jgi:hypothetical protein